MMKLLNRFMCWRFGHRRGKRTAESDAIQKVTGYADYRCPRCGATWTRRIKVKPNNA